MTYDALTYGFWLDMIFRAIYSLTREKKYCLTRITCLSMDSIYTYINTSRTFHGLQSLKARAWKDVYADYVFVSSGQTPQKDTYQ